MRRIGVRNTVAGIPAIGGGKRHGTPLVGRERGLVAVRCAAAIDRTITGLAGRRRLHDVEIATPGRRHDDVDALLRGKHAPGRTGPGFHHPVRELPGIGMVQVILVVDRFLPADHLPSLGGQVGADLLHEIVLQARGLGDSDIVASMTVFVDGRPLKRDYKRFKLKGLDGADDYQSMRQVIERRFTRYLSGDPGFDTVPDILLIDGGSVHANTVRAQITSMGIDIPVFGMVKDDRHRTRALVTPDGEEIGIQGSPVVFSLIGRIQEETHRFAITFQRLLRSKGLRHSSLDQIPGIGEKRKHQLLRHFKTIKAISEATEDELRAVVPKNAAREIYKHYHSQSDVRELQEDL